MFHQTKYLQNLNVIGSKIYSYNTHVATIYHYSKMVAKHRYYSRTTTKHVNYVAKELGYDVTELRSDEESEYATI